MKVNKFDVDSELAISADGILSGWFETPALPHVRYTLEIDLNGLVPPVVEEIELTDVQDAPTGPETVQLPDDSVATVNPTQTAPAPPEQPQAPEVPASDPGTGDEPDAA